ncbi:MAG TPA: matrixin family metalloprotease [Chthoniobacterales bacterium]
MNFCALIDLLPSRRTSFRRIVAVASLALLCAEAQLARAYVLEGKSWPGGSNVVMQLGLGSAGRTLTDGNTSYNAAVEPSLGAWNQVIGRVQLGEVMDSLAALSSGDRVNTVSFSPTVFGQSFGSGTLAVTYYITQGTSMLEADVLFNLGVSFDSYRGPLRFGSNGYAVADIRRVFLHELGHALGLNHQPGDDVMNPTISDREVLASDDIAGVQSLYGAPVAAPTPPPPAASTLVNISTRAQVGINDNVLIGGFIIQGTTPKKLLLRAIGPSLTQYGVAGALQDPQIELHDGSGALITTNDDWQTGGQLSAILATGKAPTDQHESALIATLAPGNYTAIVRGANSTQGVALVEGYELDTPQTLLSNISTRGVVGTGDGVMIAGFIVQGGSGKKVIVRAVGPSLAPFLNGWLANPTLTLYNSSGTALATNDDWRNGSQYNEIVGSGHAPTSDAESAIVATLPPGSYTAIVSGANGGTGVGMVEVYGLN